MKKYIPHLILTITLLISITFNIIQCVNTNRNNSNIIFNDNIHSIVEIKATTENVGESFGTAEFFDSDGTLITNAHVVTYKKMGSFYAFENFSIRFSFETEYRNATLVKYDNDLDIAVLKLDDINCDFEAISINENNNLKFSDEVYAIGNLNNLGLSITCGIISNPSINVTYENNTRNVIQCDLTISDGNSGGALINSKGELVG
ncbi:MAG: serine protease, partial [Candidatus Cloacimonetes bacterium]|nr:serine protease [Candidatus Cloacimonadota bacterium]